MRRFVMTVVAALAMVASTVGPASATAASHAADEMVDAIIVLRSQADLSNIVAPTRQQRLRLVVKALQDRATATQRGALNMLAARSAQGSVASMTPLWGINAIEVKARASVIRELAARPEVREVRPNFTLQAPAAATATASTGPTEPNIALVNAPAMWDLGYRGQGVVVANMDTGVDVSHPELAASWRGGSGSWYDPNGQHPTIPTDVNGHGTQTMGVMVGKDAGGSAIGVAPDAKWIAVKIFNDRGQATSAGIHQGFQWLLDPDGNPATADAPNVVNNSWTMSAGSCSLEFQLDLRSLRSAGILPIFAAGNYGPATGTSASPANNPEALAVGSTDDSDAIDPSSSRGPSACGQAVYPQLTAPGVGIRSTDLYGGYISSSGTSMAAPHVSGAVALLLQAFPGLPADRQVTALQSGSVDLGALGPDNTYGAGRLDVRAAYDWLRSTPDFGVSVSPSSSTTQAGGSVSYTVTVTGTAGFTGDVALHLDGLPSAQGTASFSPPQVTGPGTSQLTVTTAATATPGTTPLTVVGTSGGQTRSAAASVTVVAPPDFALGASPGTQSVAAGSTAAYSVSVTPQTGFTGNVSLSVSGLPSGVGTATVTPAVVSGSGTAQLSVSTLSTSPAGTYPITVTGTSGTKTHSVSVNLTVFVRDFTLGAAPASISVDRTQTASYIVTASPSGGFTGAVTLKVAGLPTGSSATWVGNPITVPGSATLKVRTTVTTARGTFTLRLTGTSGALVHQVSVTLIVR